MSDLSPSYCMDSDLRDDDDCAGQPVEMHQTSLFVRSLMEPETPPKDSTLYITSVLNVASLLFLTFVCIFALSRMQKREGESYTDDMTRTDETSDSDLKDHEHHPETAEGGEEVAHQTASKKVDSLGRFLEGMTDVGEDKAIYDNPYVWMKAPFICTGTGAFVGFLLELLLIFRGEPYHPECDRILLGFQHLRFLIYAFSLNTGTFFTFCMTFTESDLRKDNKLYTYMAVFITGFLSIAAFYAVEEWVPLFVFGSLFYQLKLGFGATRALLTFFIAALPWIYAWFALLVLDSKVGVFEYVETYRLHSVFWPLIFNLYFALDNGDSPWGGLLPWSITTPRSGKTYSPNLALVFATMLHISALLMGNETPFNSFVFHLLASGMIFCAWRAIDMKMKGETDFGEKVHETIWDDKPWATLFPTFLVGCIVPTRLLAPRTYFSARTNIAQWVWTSLYFALLHRPLLKTNPKFLLREVHTDGAPNEILLTSYTDQHPNFMPRPWHIQVAKYSEDHYPESFQVFQELVDALSMGFLVMTTIGQFFPLADVEQPIALKPRLKPTDDARAVIPFKVFSLYPGFPLQGKEYQRVPEPVIEAYKDGRLLGHLCQFGIGNTFLRLAEETDVYPFYREVESVAQANGVVVDFSGLEKYETKDDYYPYGGIAFMHTNTVATSYTADKRQILDVKWMIQPGSQVRVYKNKYDGSYYRISHMLVASLYFQVVAGKHLIEIHMRLELLEIALHNVFDHGLNSGATRNEKLKFHPLRLVLYPHLFSHVMTSELTVTHLVQQGAVFNQIFATKYHSLLDYMTDLSTNFAYGADEDWEFRERVCSYLAAQEHDCLRENLVKRCHSSSPEFNSQYEWEQCYRYIWDDYAEEMVDAMYVTNGTQVEDAAVKKLHATLSVLFSPKGLPSRYEKFQSKGGLRRFLSDTIHHLVIGHNIYGTNGVTSGAMDPRINVAQLPKDMGPPAVDEFRAFAFVALATAYPHFTELLQKRGYLNKKNENKLQGVFNDASGHLVNYPKPQGMLREAMRRSFSHMMTTLAALGTDWAEGDGDRSEADFFYMYGIPRPKDLKTGPGY